MTEDTDIRSLLGTHGLRPTRQRVLAGEILFDGVDKHITAEALHREIAARQSDTVSLATVYNTLSAFTSAGLLRSVTLDTGSVYYDTNTDDHHHIYDVNTRELSDIDIKSLEILGLPTLPKGKTLDRVDVIIRVK